VLLVTAGLDALRSLDTETATSATRTTPTGVETSLAPQQTTEAEASLPPRQRIARTGNEWAPLFAAARDREAIVFQTQPLSERIACERVGGIEIRNCKPPSSAFRRSFEDATVEDVEILGDQAGARFSNGQVVVLVGSFEGAIWLIHKVRDAGGKFFK
jgi:hypothetical protein